MKKATLNEFIEIAIQAKRTHQQLLKLFDLTNGKLPKSITRHLFTMQTGFWKFKDQAEERMAKQHPNVLESGAEEYPDFVDIFYGGFKALEGKPELPAKDYQNLGDIKEDTTIYGRKAVKPDSGSFIFIYRWLNPKRTDGIGLLLDEFEFDEMIELVSKFFNQKR